MVFKRSQRRKSWILTVFFTYQNRDHAHRCYHLHIVDRQINQVDCNFQAFDLHFGRILPSSYLYWAKSRSKNQATHVRSLLAFLVGVEGVPKQLFFCFCLFIYTWRSWAATIVHKMVVVSFIFVIFVEFLDFWWAKFKILRLYRWTWVERGQSIKCIYAIDKKPSSCESL